LSTIVFSQYEMVSASSCGTSGLGQRYAARAEEAAVGAAETGPGATFRGLQRSYPFDGKFVLQNAENSFDINAPTGEPPVTTMGAKWT